MPGSGGVLRRHHVHVLTCASTGLVYRGSDFEYHARRVDGTVHLGRPVTNAVYLLESHLLVVLQANGDVLITDAGREYLQRRERLDAVRSSRLDNLMQPVSSTST